MKLKSTSELFQQNNNVLHPAIKRNVVAAWPSSINQQA
jgi:hypothetical protein